MTLTLDGLTDQLSDLIEEYFRKVDLMQDRPLVTLSETIKNERLVADLFEGNELWDTWRKELRLVLHRMQKQLREEQGTPVVVNCLVEVVSKEHQPGNIDTRTLKTHFLVTVDFQLV